MIDRGDPMMMKQLIEIDVKGLMMPNLNLSQET
jgi:hypothetical protein